MNWFITYKKYIFIVTGVFIVFILYLSFGQQEEIETVPFVFEEIETKDVVEQVDIFVDVKGAVVKEGVYSLQQGARVKDAIELAGGFLEDANKNAINLAQLLTDEMLLYIPFLHESTQAIQVQPVDDGKVNLNTATSSDLETLPNIGPAKALAIIQYREKNGPFQSIEDLKNVDGIGEKTYEKLKENIKIK